MALNSFFDDLKNNKFDDHNYDHWYRIVIYVCDELDITYNLKTKMKPLIVVDGDLGHMPTLSQYEKWVKNNRLARNMLLRYMHLNLYPFMKNTLQLKVFGWQ